MAAHASSYASSSWKSAVASPVSCRAVYSQTSAGGITRGPPPAWAVTWISQARSR